MFEKDTQTTGTVNCVDNINNSEGTSEFCEDKTNGEIINGVSTYTHPAFTFGGKELTGFWYGKFEDSVDSSSHILIKPDVISNRNKTLATRFQEIRSMELKNNIYGFPSNATAYTETGDLTGDNNNFDTHLTRNMEWGAVAYLTQSKYGRCTNGNCSEIYFNNGGYTGRSAGNISENSTYIINGSYSYDDYIINSDNVKTSKVTGKGTGASTTGNIYGIYDMSGGLWDITMGLMMNIDSNTSTSIGFTSYPNKKYYDAYSYGTTNTNDNAYKRGKLGDATKEILKIPNSNNGWYEDSLFLGDTDDATFIRGGSGEYESGKIAGIFLSFTEDSIARGWYTDRSVLAIY